MLDKEFWENKKVLITGHTGFKGSWLSIWLHKLGANICGFGLEPNTVPSLFELASISDLIESHIGDVRDLNHLKKVILQFKPEIIFHMAAQSLVIESYKNPVETYSTNVMGTVNLLECVRFCSSVKAVINVTTDKVYENQEWDWGYRENDALGGYDPYSNSKTCSEMVTSSYVNSYFNSEKYKDHGIAIATARAGNVIGGGDWADNRLIPDVLRAIENDSEIIIRNPNAVRPWQHVLEPLSGYLMLAEKLYIEGSKWNGAWNFGPYNDGISSVQDLLSYFEFGNNVKYEESLLHETTLLTLDISKSKSRLNWTPNLNLRQTIKLIEDWTNRYLNGESILKICIEQIEYYYLKGRDS